MKRLIVCCDGTANDPDQMDRDRIAPTNVVKLTRALKLKTEDGHRQVIYYDQGVGTGWWAKKLVEGLSGAGISQNIMDAYSFLAQNYEEGDEIYCFGFSRGAFTVRSLCGFIHTVGLLKKEHSQANVVKDIYDAYRSTRPAKETDTTFKTSFQNVTHPSINIKFLGVWDTVGSLGFPLLPNLVFEWNKHHNVHHFKETVENAFHALALEEFRGQFRPSFLTEESVKGTLVQKWFAGSHSNVGGGYVDDGLSDITLVRMIEQAKQYGLEFDETFINNSDLINPVYFGELRNSRKGFYKALPKNVRLNNGELIKVEDLDNSVIQRLLDPTTGYYPHNADVEHSHHLKNADLEDIEHNMIEEFYETSIDKVRNTGKVRDKFPIYLARGAVIVLLIWLLGSLFFVSSDYGLGISLEVWKNAFLTVGEVLWFVLVIPFLALIAILILVVIGFTAVSIYLTSRLKSKMKDKVY